MQACATPGVADAAHGVMHGDPVRAAGHVVQQVDGPAVVLLCGGAAAEDLLDVGGQRAMKVEPELRLEALRVYNDAMAEMLDRNKRAMRAIIKMVVPEKKAYFETAGALGEGAVELRAARLNPETTGGLLEQARVEIGAELFDVRTLSDGRRLRHLQAEV